MELLQQLLQLQLRKGELQLSNYQIITVIPSSESLWTVLNSYIF